MKNEAIISATDLSIGYAKGKARESLYDDLSFSLYPGQLTCLLGENGAGKSTLLRTLSAMQPPLGGNIYVKEKLLTEYSEQDLSRVMGLVLTDKTSVGGFTVRELVSLGRYPYTGFWGKLSAEDKAIVDNAMTDVGITHKANNYMADLSDGERQKAMIAKALAQQCPIILLDEPTAFLDVASRMEIMNLLHHLVYNQKIAILLSTHDIEVALMLADKLWLLSPKDGLTCGTTEDIILSGKMEKFFGKNNILFEKETGRFRPVTQWARKVFLKAGDEYEYWIKNLLHRNNFETVPDISDAEFTIHIHSIHQIDIEKENTHQSASSIDELIDILKKS